MKIKILYILFAFLFIGGCGDIVTTQYESYQEAKESGLFERGWLPDILPESTTKILTKNNLDLNTSNGHFEIPIEHLPIFTAQLVKNGGDKYTFTEKTITGEWHFEIIPNTGYVNYVLQ